LNPITAPRSNAESDSRAKVSLHIRLALHAIHAYQLLISPYFGGSCRFLPSCSAYAAEAIATHGLLRGGWLSARRLARCHPLCTAGHDPVPRVSVSTSSETRPRFS
jgi:putative membrane protein insertion efficiency factor